MADLQNLTGIMVNIILILSVPAALYRYFRTTEQQRRDREYGTYDALGKEYIDFLKLCFEHPYLDVYDLPDKEPVALTPLQKKEELIAFNILVSMFERAFLMYHDQSSEIKRQQWQGWDEYIHDYCARANFQSLFDSLFYQFDESFVSYIKKASQEVIRQTNDDHDT